MSAERASRGSRGSRTREHRSRERKAWKRETKRFPPQTWLVVGLGNPGSECEQTRHNLGARVVQELRRHMQASPFRHFPTLLARVSRGGNVLAIPTTFMNASGKAVQALCRKLRVPLDHLLIVHDDKDLSFGWLKLQRGRGAAGHRGVESVIAALESNDFWRLRIGIGSPPEGIETDAYVLERFRPEETIALAENVIPRAVRWATDWLAAGEEAPKGELTPMKSSVG